MRITAFHLRTGFFVAIWLVVAAIFAKLDAFEAFFEFSRAHEDWELDEIVAVCLAAMIAGSTWLAVEVHLKAGLARKALQAQLAAERELHLAKRNRALNILSAGLAHSGNNLLQPILTLSRISLKQLDSRHPAYANLEKIGQVAEQATKLFKSFDSFSREHVTSSSRVDLSDFLRKNETILSLTVPQNASLKSTVNCEYAPISLDASEITDLLFVLLSNAVDSLEGQPGQISIDLSVKDETIALVIADTGKGIDEADLEHIFDPFFTTKQLGSGTGLGLHIARTLMDRANGHISVRSTPGQGSTFALEFPMQEQAQ